MHNNHLIELLLSIFSNLRYLCRSIPEGCLHTIPQFHLVNHYKYVYMAEGGIKACLLLDKGL